MREKKFVTKFGATLVAMLLMVGLWIQSGTAANATGGVPTLEPPEAAIPVVLSEDGSVWYDQCGTEITAEGAEWFFTQHPEYWKEIYQYNVDWAYLSAWQGQARLSKLTEMGETLAVGTNQQIADDGYCWSIAEGLIGNPPEPGTLAGINKVLPLSAGEDIGRLTYAVWYRDSAYLEKADATHYIFWCAVANLVDEGVYDINNVNNLSLIKWVGPAYVPGYEPVASSIVTVEPAYIDIGEPPVAQ